MDDLEKDDFLRRYCLMLNSLNVSFKILMINNNQDMEQVRRDVFIREKDGQFSEMVQSFNKYISDRVLEGHSGLTQVRIFVLSVRKKDVVAARDYFRSIEANLTVNFSKMESALIPMDGTDRLRYLYAFWHMGEGKQLTLTWEQMVRKARDWKDFVAPQHVGYFQDEYGAMDGITLQFANRYSRVLYLPHLPSGVNPEIMNRFLSGDYQCSVTIDAAAIPMDAVRKRLNDLYMQVGRTIEKQQETRNRAGAWSSDVSYEVRRQKSEIEELLDVINDNNERMFYVGVYVVINAPTRKELENNVTAFCSAAEGEGFHFEPVYWEQVEAFHTASPCGARFCNTMYPLLTQPLAAFTPFIVHELYQPGGIAYGVNQISRNILIGDRKTLLNGNGFILGLSGSGKGMETKKEITEIFLTTDDDIIVIDPMNEYEAICDYFHGQFIDFSSTSKHYINPQDQSDAVYFFTDQGEQHGAGGQLHHRPCGPADLQGSRGEELQDPDTGGVLRDPERAAGGESPGACPIHGAVCNRRHEHVFQADKCEYEESFHCLWNGGHRPFAVRHGNHYHAGIRQIKDCGERQERKMHMGVHR